MNDRPQTIVTYWTTFMPLPGQTGRWKLCLYQARLDGGSYASTRPDWTVEAMRLPGQTGRLKLCVYQARLDGGSYATTRPD